MATRQIGIPAVPRGLNRDLANFLEAIAQNVKILSGATRGLENVQALRVEDTKEFTYVRDKSITSEKINDNAVTTLNIENKAVTNDKIADMAVTSNKIANRAVTQEKLDNDSVTTEKINNKAVTADKLSDDAIDVSKFPNKSITAEKIADSTIGTQQIADGAIVYEKLGDNAKLNIYHGVAEDGETIFIEGTYQEKPAVFMQSFFNDTIEVIGITQLTETTQGKWEFVASGAFSYVVVGYVL